MTIKFVDRESAYPNRYLVTPDNGSSYYVLLERADEPVTAGTPLNAETFNRLIAELEAMITKLTLPDYGESDYGKVLSCSADGLVWVTVKSGSSTSGSGLYNAEEVSF